MTTMHIAAAGALALLVGCSGGGGGAAPDRTAPRLLSWSPGAGARLDPDTPAVFTFDEPIALVGAYARTGGAALPQVPWPVADGAAVTVRASPDWLIQSLEPRAVTFGLHLLAVEDGAGNEAEVHEALTFVDVPPLDRDVPATAASLALGPGGKPAVAWAAGAPLPDCAMLARWSSELFTEGDYGWYRTGLPPLVERATALDLATAPDGSLVLAARRFTGSASSFEVYQDGIWGFETLGIPGVDWRGLDLRVAADGAVHVAWAGTPNAPPAYGDTPQLHVARRDADRWTELGAALPVGGCAASPSLALPDGTPIVAYVDGCDVSGAPPAVARVARWTGAAWQDLALPAAVAGGVPAIAARGGVAFVAVRLGAAVRVLHLAGDAWEDLGDATGGALGDVTSAAIAIDASGAPVVASAGTAGPDGGPLGVRRFAGGGWEPMAFDALVPGTAATIDGLEADASGAAVLAWREQDPGARSRLYVRRVPAP